MNTIKSVKNEHNIEISVFQADRDGDGIGNNCDYNEDK